MEQSPVSQMQQLVSHWSTIMQSEKKTKKRGRDDESDTAHIVTKPRTQDTGHPDVKTYRVQSETTSRSEPFAHGFS